MYPEDRVLVAHMPGPTDFAIVQKHGWYRIPKESAPKGLYAEYFAFYFGRRFGSEKWAIHYYARNLGHELVTRHSLFPEESNHPRAQNLYYKVQLGPLVRLERPIPSLRWRRVTFIHSTWDRFSQAAEINDLFVDGDEYVDRLYAALRERGVQAERNYRVEEPGITYEVALAVFGDNGRIDIIPAQIPHKTAAIHALADRIVQQSHTNHVVDFD